jgi:hypothetical protein
VFYSDPTYDTIYYQSIQEANTAARHLLINDLQRIAHEHFACQCVAYKPSLYAASTVHWTDYGDWAMNIPLALDLAMPYLYVQL